MKIVLIGNISNGIGLERDASLLRAFLTARRHTVALQSYDQPPIADASSFDLSISLETVSEHLLPLSSRRWLIANPEWTKPESLRSIQRDFQLVLAKTRDADSVLRRHFDHVRYVGFLCEDRRDPTIQRWPFALHLGGNSGYRNTNAVIAAWREYRYWDDTKLPNLIVISASRETTVPPNTPGIDFDKRIEDDDELKKLQNQCLFHIMPSAYEGYGHALHEAQSVGAIILTTGAGPMAELRAPFEVLPSRTRRACLATLYDVSPLDIRRAVSRMVEQPSHELARMSLNARMEFERGNEEFAIRFEQILSPDPIEITITPPALFGGGEPVTLMAPSRALSTTHSPLRIALLGNLSSPHSTESDLAWTLSSMGHSVLPFQENETTTDDILRQSLDRAIHLLLYVHTHGWDTPGTLSLDSLLAALRGHQIPTASFHLDRYVGLDLLDGRQSRVGTHPFWRTDTVFTADGGNQAFFTALGVNHVWLPPAVVRRDCHAGNPDGGLTVDVAFVGATSYHPEYPFRSDLISFLRSTYGERFRVFQGYRGQRLNDLYASVGVCVGDSCFANNPEGIERYISDRVPETMGRGGVLVHAEVEGISWPGLVTHRPGDLLDMANKIDWLLSHPKEREACRTVGMSWVAENETYSNRMQSLLRHLGL